MYPKLVPLPNINPNSSINMQGYQQNNKIAFHQYYPNNDIIINQPRVIPAYIISFDQPKYVTQIWKPKIIRQKVELDQKAIEFKERFYSFFTYKKRIQKKFVFNVHNNIASKIELRYVTREETRSVDKYFHNFSKYQNKIIEYLDSLSEEDRKQLLHKTPEPVYHTENIQ